MAAILKMLKPQQFSHTLLEFDKSWRVDTLWVPGNDIALKTGTGSRNEPSAAAILNFIFREYIGLGFGPICTKLVPDYPILLKFYMQ